MLASAHAVSTAKFVPRAGYAAQYRRANRSARCLAYQRHFAALPTSRRFRLTSPCFFTAKSSRVEYHTR